MRRLLLGLATLAALLALLDGWLERQQQARRANAGVLRPLPRQSAKPVVRLQVDRGNATWVYVRRDSLWRYPARYNAFVLPAPMDYLVDGLLRGAATALPPNGPCGRAAALTLRLSDSHGNTVQEVAVGRGVPGRLDGEACLQSGGRPFQLHANPHRVLQGDPPMVDPFVLPRALERRDIARIEFGAAAPVSQLERIQIGPALPLPGQPPRGPTHRWVARRAGRVDTCNEAGVQAYTAFLDRLRYQRLVNPQGDQFGFAPDQTITLVDGAGRSTELSVGRTTDDGLVYLKHRQADLIYALNEAKAALLFPTPAALLDSLATPSPYQRAEPAQRPPGGRLQ